MALADLVPHQLLGHVAAIEALLQETKEKCLLLLVRVFMIAPEQPVLAEHVRPQPIQRSQQRLVLEFVGRLLCALLGIGMMAAGVTITLSVVGAPLGIPLAALGFLLLIRALF